MYFRRQEELRVKSDKCTLSGEISPAGRYGTVRGSSRLRGEMCPFSRLLLGGLVYG